MKDTDLPPRFNIAFASSQVAPFIRNVPDAPSGVAGAASLQLGFPGPDCFTPPTAGGTPPFGEDFNGLLLKVTQWNRWQAAGAPTFYDAGFATAIAGYPKSALLASTSYDGLVWRSQVDDNTTNPDDPATTANWAPFNRVSLTAALTLHVSTSGNDVTGNGTSGSPYRTVQKAVNMLVTYYDWRGFGVTIQRDNSVSAYTDNTTISGRFVGQAGNPLIITASSSTNVTVAVAASEVYKVDAGAFVSVQNQKITNSIGAGLYCTRSSTLLHSGMDFGTTVGTQINTDRLSNSIQTGDSTISGGAASHVSASAKGVNEINGNITLTGSPAFATFANCTDATIQTVGSTFIGTATGKKFAVTANGIISTNGTNPATYLPGDVAGTQTQGGLYV